MTQAGFEEFTELVSVSLDSRGRVSPRNLVVFCVFHIRPSLFTLHFASFVFIFPVARRANLSPIAANRLPRNFRDARGNC